MAPALPTLVLLSVAALSFTKASLAASVTTSASSSASSSSSSRGGSVLANSE